MELYGFFADAEDAGDLFDGELAQEKIQHLAFSKRGVDGSARKEGGA